MQNRDGRVIWAGRVSDLGFRVYDSGLRVVALNSGTHYRPQNSMTLIRGNPQNGSIWYP